MLKQRVVTALLLGALFLAGLFGLSPGVFSLIVAVVVVYAGWEWSNLAGFTQIACRWIYTLIVAGLLAVATWLLGLSFQSPPDVTVAQSFVLTGCLWWLVALFLVATYPSSSGLWGSRWTRSIMGLLVLMPAWVAIVFLVHQPAGSWLVLLAVLIIVLADVGAYFSGRRFGRHKLALSVSPGKTWEGFLGGLSANLLLALILGLFFQQSVPGWLGLLLVVVVSSVASVLGDLVESMVKRHRGVKDSGGILPGHGGVLDRIDSVCAALPVFSMLYLMTQLDF